MPTSTPFPTPVLFPYEPNGADSITETVSYVTNVIISRNDSEQRMALRRRPVLRLKWRITAMEPQDAGRVAGLLYNQINNRWYVPIWPDARRVTGVAGLVYTVDTTGARFDFSGKALVWRDPDTCDVMDVSAVGTGTVTLAGATTFNHALPGVYLIPLGIGSLPATFSTSKQNFVTDGTVEFTLDTTGMTSIAARVPTQLFRGVEVLTIHPSSEANQSEKWTISSERVGTDLGPFLMRPFSTTPVIDRPYTWVLTTFQEIADFRGWLSARRGRKSPLWVPTYQDDFTLMAPAAQNAGSIDIADVDFATKYFGTTSRVHIAALLPDGTVVPMTVQNVTVPVAGTERLFLEAPLPIALSKDIRVCLLVYARLTDDAVELEHMGPGLAVAKGGFTELPRETPA